MRTPQEPLDESNSRSHSLGRTKINPTTQQDIRTSSDSWQGKVLRNRVIPPVNHKLLNIVKPTKEVVTHSSVSAVPAPAYKTFSSSNTQLASKTTNNAEALRSSVQVDADAVQPPTTDIISTTATRQMELAPRTYARLNPPPPFDGSGARNWLFQIETYHKSIGQPDALRVNDAVSFLTGAALDDYGLMASQGEDPQTWEEFRRWVLQRFNHQSESETVTRLLEIRWQGSLDLLCSQFAAIVSQGEPPSHRELQRLFIRALPLELVDLLDRTDFDTWLQIKDFLIAKTKPKDFWKNMWLTSVPQSVLENSWRRAPHLFPTAFQQLAHKGQLPQGTYNGLRPVNKATTPWPSHPPTNGAPRNSVPPSNANSATSRANIPSHNSNPFNTVCLTCRGVGHIAAHCPNSNPQMYKEGSTCNRCRGVGHWAAQCPSPVLPHTNSIPTQPKRNHNFEKGNGAAQRNLNESGNGSA